MADSSTFLTLTDLAKINDANVRDLGMSDLLDEAPLLKVLYATTASNGTTHSYLKQTGAPSVGFRAINVGRDRTPSADTQVNVTLKYLDAEHSPIDVAYAKGYRGGREAAIAREVKRALKQAFFEFESQILNGTGNDSDGFSGLANSLNLTSNSMVVDATGSTANSATSVYLIRTTTDELGMAAVLGQDGSIDVGESYVTECRDSNGKTFSGYRTPAGAWLALQIGGARSVARICNITAQSGKGVTDALIYRALKLFPASQQPTHIVMNRTGLEQLRSSRSAVRTDGAAAVRPTEVEGFPIITTDAIGDTEAIVTAS